MKYQILELVKITGVSQSTLRTILCRPLFNEYKCKADKGRAVNYEYSEGFRNLLLEELSKQRDILPFLKYKAKLKGKNNE